VASKAKAPKKPAKQPATHDVDDWLNDDAPDVTTGGVGDVVTKQKLAQLFGLSGASIDKAFANGAPVIAKGNKKQGWQINSAAFFAWYTRWKVESVTGDPDAMDFEKAKTRVQIATAERIERENRKKERELVPIADVITVLAEEASNVRSHLMTVPGRLAVTVAAESDPVACEALIQDEINLALANITSDNAEGWTDDDADGTDSDAAPSSD
jgi:phage terminase Nu1 subunit (DNA packaging protein)